LKDKLLTISWIKILKIYSKSSIYYSKKEYKLNSETGIKKYRVFKENVRKIKEHNAKGLSWWEAVNEFTDLTFEEFKAYFNIKPINPEDINELVKKQGRFLEKEINFDLQADDDDDDIPTPALSDVNWGSRMNTCRNQGQCGSCWAFSTMGALEGVLNIKYNTATPYLSTQQLVDCNTQSNGCNGGWQPYALTYLESNGPELDSSYPYTAVKGTCGFNNSLVKYTVKGYSACDSMGWFSQTPCTINNWRGLLQKGPISVVISATDAFQNYGGGIIDASNMTCAQLDHAVVAYAWTTSGSNSIISVRNSWGTSWGNQGNFQIYYTSAANSTCWITKLAFLPKV